MNVFEDLIEELKEENLLEETVIEAGLNAAPAHSRPPFEVPERLPAAPVVENFEPSRIAAPIAARPPVPPAEDAVVPAAGPVAVGRSDAPAGFELPSAPLAEIPDFEPSAPPALSLPMADVEPPLAKPKPAPPAISPRTSFEKPAAAFAMPPMPQFGETARPVVSQREFFKRRAIDEVTGLQMVDHVLSGVEREQMKVAPKPFDDIPVKKALHDFMQVSAETGSPDHARAEFQLMQETENWYSSLSHRDRYISVAHLRRYCETTKPALSPQALIAMGRFYRNSPFSEQVRNKFDLIMTRLFTREVGNEKRELLFDRTELAHQIKDLYADWSSIQIYSSEEDDSEILIAGLKIDDFVTEAEGTDSFDELIANDFFNRLRLFKESLAENFFAPMITIASVEANVRIGNRYVDLIERERETANAAMLEEKYGFLHDQAISDSTGKTLQLIELLQDRVAGSSNEDDLVEIHVDASTPPPASVEFQKPRGRFAVNKWLLALMFVTVAVCGGLYFWAQGNEREIAGTLSTKVKKVNLENSSMKEYLQAARINEDTLYGITSEKWADLPMEKKNEILKKLLLIGPDKGFTKVQLLNEKGRSVGFASPETVETYVPQQ